MPRSGVRHEFSLPEKLAATRSTVKLAGNGGQRSQALATSAISESHPDAPHTAEFMTSRRTPEPERGRHPVQLAANAGAFGFPVTTQLADRSFQSRSKQSDRAFSPPACSARLFLYPPPLWLKSTERQSYAEMDTFPEGIREGGDVQEKSHSLPADRCLNQASEVFAAFSQILREVTSYLVRGNSR
jgi:hypothetical protein